MRQLTLEDICGYSPYRLMIFAGKAGYNDPKTSIMQMSGCFRNRVVCNEFEDFYFGDNSEWFPILHPLSDLTKPITVEGYNDGKEFVPMVHLFLLSDGIYPIDKNVDFKVMSSVSIMVERGAFSSILFSTAYGYSDERIESSLSFFTRVYDHVGRTYITPDKDEPFISAIERFSKVETKVPSNQLLLFKMLHKWHFDVHGLIDANLAIDLNSIK